MMATSRRACLVLLSTIALTCPFQTVVAQISEYPAFYFDGHSADCSSLNITEIYIGCGNYGEQYGNNNQNWCDEDDEDCQYEAAQKYQEYQRQYRYQYQQNYQAASQANQNWQQAYQSYSQRAYGQDADRSNLCYFGQEIYVAGRCK